MNSKQIEAIIRLPGADRYAHFIKAVADRQCVWGLYADGWALAATSEETPVFPLWPAREYAELFAAESWSGYSPRGIEMEDLFEGLLPSLRERGTLLGVFPTFTDKGVLPDLDVFEDDLRSELARLE